MVCSLAIYFVGIFTELKDIRQNLEKKIGREALQRQISRKRQESESESIDSERGRHSTG